MLYFCSNPDKNGNFLLLDVNLAKKTYKHGYFFRIANRADNVVVGRKEMRKLVEQFKACGYTKE